MKFLFSMIIVLLNFSSVYAGDKVLNGGNVIVCANTDGSVMSVELLDYYEVRLNNGSLKFNSDLPSYNEKLIDLFSKWEAVAPKRMVLYRKWLNEFPQEAGVYSNINIPAIPDTGSIAIPKGCSLQPVAFQRRDEDIFPGTKRYVINKDLWDLMSEDQKAGLVLHELIYREAIKVGNKTSLPTRYLNGHLASTEPDGLKYSLIVSQMPLEWVEVGGGMVMHVGRLNCRFGSNCEFKNDLNISADGKTLRGSILQFIGNVATTDIKINFRELPEHFFEWGKFIIDFKNGEDFRFSKERNHSLKICKHIVDFAVKDLFSFYDITGKYCNDNLHAATAVAPMNLFDEFFTVDSSRSWIRNADQTFIKNLIFISTPGSQLTTSDQRNWYFYPDKNYTAYEKCFYSRYGSFNNHIETYYKSASTKTAACELAKIECSKSLKPKEYCKLETNL